MSPIKPVTSGIRLILVSLLGFMLQTPAVAQTDQVARANTLIQDAISRAGGAAWEGMATLTVHESQARNTDQGVLQMEIVHTMDTKGRGYRMEISSSQGKQVYGWDGEKFWALVDGKPGDETQLRDARRLISDAFYRFSLPFILADEGPQIEYAGTDTVDGKPTEVVKITYTGNPVDDYWKAGEHHGGGHGDDKHAAGAGDHAGHQTAAEGGGHGGDHGGGHHGDNQIYFYHFDEDERIVKIYFSHHGDDSYETFLFGDFTTIDGILREQSRKLIRADGQTHYDTRFTRAVFSSDSNTELYQSPHH